MNLRSGTAVSSYYEAGFLGISVDLDGGQKAGAPPMAPMHPYGFVSRPADPVADAGGIPTLGCEVLYGWDGPQGYVLPLGDPRVMAKLPEVQGGESFQYGPTGQFVRCHADGSISLFTTDDATTDGRSIYLKISPTTGLEYSCPWGRLTFGPNGFHVLHSSGARLDLGAIGGLPGPLSSLSSYAKLEGGIASVKGGAVSVGTDGGATNEAATTALVAFLDALVAAVATITPSTTGAAAMATLTAAAAAMHVAIPKIGKVV